jgi:hypothetical protein
MCGVSSFPGKIEKYFTYIICLPIFTWVADIKVYLQE